MGVILDTSALIGLHETDTEVRQLLVDTLRKHDDSTSPRVHQVTLGELWSGVLYAEANTPGEVQPRRFTLETAESLETERVHPRDFKLFGEITLAAGRKLSHNDRWICAAALRTELTLLTQDAAMADAIHAHTQAAPVAYIPRDPGDI